MASMNNLILIKIFMQAVTRLCIPIVLVLLFTLQASAQLPGVSAPLSTAMDFPAADQRNAGTGTERSGE